MNKQSLKSLWLVFVMLCMSLNSFAFDVKVDGIYYNLVEDTKTAEVTMGETRNTATYSGALVIPSVIKVNEAEYSVTRIGRNAFEYCSNLTSVTIPNSVTSIGGYAFLLCTSLKTVTIPNSVTSIEDCIFDWTFINTVICEATDVPSALSNSFSTSSISSGTLYVPRESLEKYKAAEYWNNWGTILPIGENITWTLSDDGTLTISGVGPMENYDLSENQAPWKLKRIKKLVIEEGVTRIGDHAFTGCSGLTSVTIPNSVTSIGNYAFSGCLGLKSVTIPNSVTSIGNYAFSSCLSLTSVTIPNSVTSIGSYAFRSCSSLTSVTIPNSVTSIGSFTFSGCM